MDRTLGTTQGDVRLLPGGMPNRTYEVGDGQPLNALESEWRTILNE
jgi:hypothetical protein